VTSSSSSLAIVPIGLIIPESCLLYEKLEIMVRLKAKERSFLHDGMGGDSRKGE